MLGEISQMENNKIPTIIFVEQTKQNRNKLLATKSKVVFTKGAELGMDKTAKGVKSRRIGGS